LKSGYEGTSIRKSTAFVPNPVTSKALFSGSSNGNFIKVEREPPRTGETKRKPVHGLAMFSA
jgi:hypothetical protein